LHWPQFFLAIAAPDVYALRDVALGHDVVGAKFEALDMVNRLDELLP
jgi:hypothetical protein